MPVSALACAIGLAIETDAFLSAFEPAAVILASIRPCELALALLPILIKLSLILLPIFPLQDSVTVHQSALKLADIATIVGPSEGALTLHLVVNEVTTVLSPVFPGVRA